MTKSTELPFFAIVGVGRSGTTLLMSMLNAHPQIVTPPEFYFVIEHIAKYPAATLEETASRLAKDRRFARLGLTVDEVVAGFLEKRYLFSNIKLYQEILQIYATRYQVKIIGDKAPKYIEYLPLIHRVFPNAKIIHLIRDPRDVYLSRTKADWSASRPDLLQFLAYRAQYDLGCRLGPKLFAGNYLEIHYEDLISSPKKELQKICWLLGIPFTDEMLNFSTVASDIVFPDEISWKKEVLGPLLNNNMNKWRKELTSEKVARIEVACSPTFSDGFYERSQRRCSVLGRVADVIFNMCMAVLTRIYQQMVTLKNTRALCVIEQKKLG